MTEKRAQYSSAHPTRMPVRTPDTVSKAIKRLHDIQGLSYRKIALMPKYFPIPSGTIQSIATTGHVPKKWWDKLNIVTKSMHWIRNRRQFLDHYVDQLVPGLGWYALGTLLWKGKANITIEMEDE